MLENFSTDELRAELQRRRDQALLDAIAVRHAANHRIAENAQLLLDIFRPDHRLVSCTDASPKDDNGCVRCALLYMVKYNDALVDLCFELGVFNKPICDPDEG